MSLDNIMGIVGVAQGNIWLVGLGMCISVPIIMFGSEFFIYLIEPFSCHSLSGRRDPGMGCRRDVCE